MAARMEQWGSRPDGEEVTMEPLNQPPGLWPASTQDSEFNLDSLISEPLESESRNWSENQRRIFEAVAGGEDLLVEAVAGSGKTTTLTEAIRYTKGSTILMAFNKSSAEDLRLKAPPMAEVKTLNAVGHRMVLDHFPEAELNARKMTGLIERVMGGTTEFKDHGYTLSRVCGLAKNSGFGITDEPEPGDFSDLIDAYGFEVPAERIEDFGFICREAFELSRLDTQTFDFDDQLWIPVKHQWKFPQYNNALIDEAQDLSPIQHFMMEGFKQAGARLIGVGDRHQAIYGFRGASHDSMDILKGKFAMKELPLDITYRCAQQIVLAAQDFCPGIKHRPGAPEGLIQWLDIDPVNFAPQTMIVCRNNAPLFRQILSYVRRKEPCQVLSNFLDSFQGFIRGFKTRYTSELRAKLDNWYEREKEAAERTGKRGKLIALKDKYETVGLLAGEYKLVEDMIALVKSLGYSKRGPIFATIHKSKGLECENIFILAPRLLDGYFATTPEAKQQEANLHYVAITRAKETLTYGASR
jgi:superfamily I DNA/RNA helicase